MKHPFFLVSVLSLVGVSAAHAVVTPNPLFADHAVLQQGISVPVWGTAEPGEAVTVDLAGKTASARTGADGKWLVRLPPIKAGGPFTLTIAGENKVVLSDILVGEVWLAGGQSNMERQLGLRAGQQPIDQWKKEIAAAKHPQIRHFGVEQTKSLAPVPAVKGQWTVCSPETIKDFTAVGYFFARDLHRARHVPVGIVHASWGGTPAEAWTSEAGLESLPDFATVGDALKLITANPEAAKRDYEAHLETWFRANDTGSTEKSPWNAPTVEAAAWKTMSLPTLWEDAGEPDLNGVVWFSKTFDLPANVATVSAELLLGMVDDVDTTWINGVKLGTTPGYNVVRKYAVPQGVLKSGRNVVTVRVLDTGGSGGIWGDQKPQLTFKGQAHVVDLSGPWRYRIGMMNMDGHPAPPISYTGDVNTPTVLYNGMIAPLVPYALAGVIFYQGEANVQRAKQYQTLLPALIADWRQNWAQGDFPFLFVQIAPHQDMAPEIREAQLIAWQHTPNTAMAVTIDCGDAKDIHPARKQPVGARLALAARALAYGEKLESSGPVFDSMTLDGGKATLRFTHLGGGLVAKGGALNGFVIAGADKVFHPAKAEIRGATVVGKSKAVAEPVAVRYGWGNVPVGNLFGKTGLPASPFRTDRD
jgi:sialate O-acetylesterase